MSGLIDANDRRTETWVKLRKFYEERLAAARRRNDNPKLTLDDTLVLRGRIAECRAILALDKELPAVFNDAPPDGA